MFWVFAAVVLVLMVGNHAFREFVLRIAYWALAGGMSGLAALLMGDANYGNSPDERWLTFWIVLTCFWAMRRLYLNVKQQVPVLRPPSDCRPPHAQRVP